MGQPGESYEKMLSQHLVQDQAEKSFTDKVLNKDDNKRLQELMKKSDITEDDIHEILHIITTVNNKLTNYDDWDRYLLGKDFAWIREFATLCVNVMNWETETKEKIEATEVLIDQYKDSKSRGVADHDNIAAVIDQGINKKPNPVPEKIKKDPSNLEKLEYKLLTLNDTLEAIHRIKQDNIHNFKFMIDVFNFLSSSTLSLGATAFDKLTSARFEYHYPEMDQYNNQSVNRTLNLGLKRR